MLLRARDELVALGRADAHRFFQVRRHPRPQDGHRCLEVGFRRQQDMYGVELLLAQHGVERGVHGRGAEGLGAGARPRQRAIAHGDQVRVSQCPQRLAVVLGDVAGAQEADAEGAGLANRRQELPGRFGDHRCF